MTFRTLLRSLNRTQKVRTKKMVKRESEGMQHSVLSPVSSLVIVRTAKDAHVLHLVIVHGYYWFYEPVAYPAYQCHLFAFVYHYDICQTCNSLFILFHSSLKPITCTVHSFYLWSSCLFVRYGTCYTRNHLLLVFCSSFVLQTNYVYCSFILLVK